MPGQFLNSRQLRDYLCCSKSTFHRLRRAGLPSRRLPDRRLFFEETAVVRWLQVNRPRRFRIIRYLQEAEERAYRKLAAREVLV